LLAVRATLMRREMALIIDLATDVALDDLSHFHSVLSALQRAKPKVPGFTFVHDFGVG